jgi:hypothetical protein
MKLRRTTLAVLAVLLFALLVPATAQAATRPISLTLARSYALASIETMEITWTAFTNSGG